MPLDQLPNPLPRLTTHTITDRDALLAELQQTRVRGYAVDREENTEGIVCFAMAVPLAAPPTDAISVSVPAARIVPESEDRITAALAKATDQLRAARHMFS
jgi:DNA-binding IclR family transcriptional regulator